MQEIKGAFMISISILLVDISLLQTHIFFYDACYSFAIVNLLVLA